MLSSDIRPETSILVRILQLPLLLLLLLHCYAFYHHSITALQPAMLRRKAHLDRVSMPRSWPHSLVMSQRMSKWSHYLHGRSWGLCTCWLQYLLRATTACTFFNISTSKSAPTLGCFWHWDCKMCLAPQWRAFFHLSSRAYFATLRGHKALENTRCFTTFWAFRNLHLLSSGSFSSLIFFLPTLPLLWLFSPVLFHLSMLSEVWCLNFLRAPLILPFCFCASRSVSSSSL